MKQLQNQKGITLTETVLYIGIISIIIVSVLSIATQLINMKVQADSMTIMTSEVTNVFEKVVSDVRGCDSFMVDENGHLIIERGIETHEYYLSDNTVYFNDGTELHELTSNQVPFTQLTFTDWTSVNSASLLHIEMEVERGAIVETFQTSVHNR